MKYAWMALLCAGSAVSSGQTVFGSAGSDADVTNAVNAFRAALGTLNANSPGSVGSGRREINWDAVPDTFSSPNAFPGDFLNQPVTPRARGAQFTTPGSHLEVSAKAANPTSTPKDFAHIDPSYAREFREFSPERLFTAIGSTIVDVTFHEPGFTTPAFTSGFGAVFSDVDTFGSTFMEFYGVNGNLLRTSRGFGVGDSAQSLLDGTPGAYLNAAYGQGTIIVSPATGLTAWFVGASTSSPIDGFSLNAIEAQSPGSKHDFYAGFLARASARFRPDAEAEQAELGACARCGSPTTGEVCAFCRLAERAAGAQPVAVGAPRRRSR